MKRRIAAVMMACLLVCLSGCSGKQSAEKSMDITLPPPVCTYEAPDGDVPVSGEGLYTLYLPGKNGMYLLGQPVTLEAAALHETAETLVRKLLKWESNDQVDSLGNGTELTLFGNHPVEISGGICTVNLGSSALQLNYRNFYIMALAVSATLCELDSVDSVNILVADKSVSLDITGGLAMGSLTAHTGENLPVLWEQMEARKTPLGSDMAQTPLTSRVTIYFPLSNGRGMICETRTITFKGQTPQQMAVGILETMSGGSMYLTGVPELPDLLDLMMYEPLASELADGGRLITLAFRADAMDILQRMNLDPACVLAAITWSLTTFIPGTAAVSVRIGDQPMTQLESERFGTVSMLGGVLRRSVFEAFMMGRTTVYFENDGLLVPCEKPVGQAQADSPRQQLAALMEGPGERERAEGMKATLPGTVDEDDILGISAVGDTMLVNLSESFRSEIQSMGPEKEMLLCYSMVNTLCDNNGMKHVYFFFEGEQVDVITGVICWSGGFDRNPGLIEPSFG